MAREYDPDMPMRERDREPRESMIDRVARLEKLTNGLESELAQLREQVTEIAHTVGRELGL